jgi:hypothetical protein
MRAVVGCAFAIGLLASNDAAACSCRLPTAEALLASSASVFTGVALQSRPAGPREAVTTFRVTVGYKGVRRGQIVRVHHRSGPSASCGLRFEIGTAHPVAASRNDAGPRPDRHRLRDRGHAFGCRRRTAAAVVATGLRCAGLARGDACGRFTAACAGPAYGGPSLSNGIKAISAASARTGMMSSGLTIAPPSPSPRMRQQQFRHVPAPPRKRP